MIECIFCQKRRSFKHFAGTDLLMRITAYPSTEKRVVEGDVSACNECIKRVVPQLTEVENP